MTEPHPWHDYGAEDDEMHVREAAVKVNQIFTEQTGYHMSQFDPSWIDLVMDILADLVSRCSERNDANKLKAMARSGQGWFSRLWGKGRVARDAVSIAVERRLYASDGRGKKLQKQQNRMVDAILEAVVQSSSNEIAMVVREATS